MVNDEDANPERDDGGPPVCPYCDSSDDCEHLLYGYSESYESGFGLLDAEIARVVARAEAGLTAAVRKNSSSKSANELIKQFELGGLAAFAYWHESDNSCYLDASGGDWNDFLIEVIEGVDREALRIDYEVDAGHPGGCTGGFRIFTTQPKVAVRAFREYFYETLAELPGGEAALDS
jgi:hypothetical protein